MMKRFCDASKINFLPFFEKAGLLKPVKAFIEDYSRGWLIITQPMIDELKAYVASKNYAEVPALNYINAYNWRNFRDKVQLAKGTEVRDARPRRTVYASTTRSGRVL